MTPREKRLLRLVRLRERQHDVAALHLRAAHGSLAVAEFAASDAQARTRMAQLCRWMAAVKDDPTERLLACADVEVSTLIAADRHTQVARAKTVVAQAADAEATIRRERRQMEATLECVQREAARQAMRAEQGTLDEIARLQRAGSAVPLASRRDF